MNERVLLKGGKFLRTGRGKSRIETETLTLPGLTEFSFDWNRRMG